MTIGGVSRIGGSSGSTNSQFAPSAPMKTPDLPKSASPLPLPPPAPPANPQPVAQLLESSAGWPVRICAEGGRLGEIVQSGDGRTLWNSSIDNAATYLTSARQAGTLLLATHYSLLTTHYSPLTTHYSLLTTHYSPLTTHYSLLTTHYLLLTTYYLLLTACYLPLTAYCLLLTTCYLALATWHLLLTTQGALVRIGA